MSIELQSSITTQPRATPTAVPRAVDTTPELGVQNARPVQASDPRLDLSANERPADRQIDQIAQRAADLMFEGREVEVRGFQDDSSGRFVYRISDKSSGQVLVQTPPDALLRFFASYEGEAKPLVSVDA